MGLCLSDIIVPYKQEIPFIILERVCIMPVFDLSNRTRLNIPSSQKSGIRNSIYLRNPCSFI